MVGRTPRESTWCGNGSTCHYNGKLDGYDKKNYIAEARPMATECESLLIRKKFRDCIEILRICWIDCRVLSEEP